MKFRVEVARMETTLIEVDVEAEDEDDAADAAVQSVKNMVTRGGHQSDYEVMSVQRVEDGSNA